VPVAQRRGREFNGELGGASEAFDVVQFAQLSVERGEWDVSGFASRFELTSSCFVLLQVSDYVALTAE
jgi:hypothetical protein